MANTKKYYPEPRNRRRFQNFSTSARKFLLFSIFVTTVAVIVAIISALLLNPEHQVKSKISALANNYYENYFYTKMENSDQFSGNPADALQKHETRGLAPITLRQLISLGEANADDAAYLSKYCDEDNTIVKFYPESPYSRTSYHTEYTYSCNF